VHAPQPGDLVVWQGHVGIVIDPDDTSFYSSVITGFSVSSFTSSYWLSRGPRRFYRYMINGLQSARLLDLFGVHKPRATPAIGSATYEPKFIADGDASERDSLNTIPAPSRRVAGGSPVSENRAPDGTVSTTRTTVLGVRATDSLGRERPTKEAIRSAFVQLSDSTAQGLQQSGFLSSAVEIVESFELGRVETQGLSGWAEFKIRKMASFADGRMKLTATAAPETVRFRLLRQAEGWTLVDSAKRIYLLRQAAISMITGRLADLSKTADSEVELKPLTKALGILLAGDRSRGERATTELRPH